MNELESWGYSPGKSMIKVWVILIQYQRVTDTDRRTDGFIIATTAPCWCAVKIITCVITYTLVQSNLLFITI